MSSEFDTVLQDALPRKSLYKVASTANATVKKKELIQYKCKQPIARLSTHEVTVDFHISGDCLVDTRNSYFSLELACNSWTAIFSHDITSIIKGFKILLPSNGNIVLEQVDNYNCLSAILDVVHRSGVEEATSKWNSAANTVPAADTRSRRFLHLNEAEKERLRSSLIIRAS